MGSTQYCTYKNGQSITCSCDCPEYWTGECLDCPTWYYWLIGGIVLLAILLIILRIVILRVLKRRKATILKQKINNIEPTVAVEPMIEKKIPKQPLTKQTKPKNIVTTSVQTGKQESAEVNKINNSAKPLVMGPNQSQLYPTFE